MTRMRLSLVVSLIALAGFAALTTFGAAPVHRADAAAACTTTAGPSTLQSVINSAGAGTVICMDAGIYRGPLTFQNKNGVTLQGAGRHATIVAGGDRDGMLIFNSQNLTFENFMLYYGHPSDAYVSNSQNIVFQQMDAGGGAIGIHYDLGSIGRISDSMVYAIEGDAVLVRPQLERHRRAQLGVQQRRRRRVDGRRDGDDDDHAQHHLGQQGAGSVRRPDAVRAPAAGLRRSAASAISRNLQSFVGDANIILDTNIIQASGSTGIVMFPGTRGDDAEQSHLAQPAHGALRLGCKRHVGGRRVQRERGARDRVPRVPGPAEVRHGRDRISPCAPSALINNDDIHDTVVLPQTGTLGGGVLAQGANLDVTNSHIHNNRGIGVSYVNTSLGTVTGNDIDDNRGSAICVFRAGRCCDERQHDLRQRRRHARRLSRDDAVIPDAERRLPLLSGNGSSASEARVSFPSMESRARAWSGLIAMSHVPPERRGPSSQSPQMVVRFSRPKRCDRMPAMRILGIHHMTMAVAGHRSRTRGDCGAARCCGRPDRCRCSLRRTFDRGRAR